MFGSVNNTSLIPLLPRLTVLSCISLISSPASNQPEGYSRSLFVCFSTGLVEKWFRCGKHQARRFIFRSERLALYQIISDRALMDRVQNRSETKQGRGIDHSWNRFTLPLLCLSHRAWLVSRDWHWLRDIGEEIYHQRAIHETCNLWNVWSGTSPAWGTRSSAFSTNHMAMISMASNDEDVFKSV